MRYLFLMDETECRSGSTLGMLKTLSEGNEIVVLSLSTLASLALRKMHIAHVTPGMFFSREKSPAIDKQAAAFSRGWYKSVDLPLMSFHGVSIGGILEYDFYYLFIDALRSVEIARTILRVSFDAIYLPSLDASIGFREVGFHTTCYETLSPILARLASQKGMRVVRLEPASNRRARTRPKRGRYGYAGLATSSVLLLLANYRDLVSIIAHRDMSRCALDNRVDDGIIMCLRTTDARGLKIYPSFVHTAESRMRARTIMKSLKSEETIATTNDEVVYDGFHLWQVLFPLVNEVVSRLIPLILGRIQWMELFVKVFRPASFVVSEDIQPVSRATCQVLKMHGIPVIVVQHGILSNDMAGMYVMPIVGDYQAVWGDYYSNWHTGRGKSPESQVVTGFPRYDGLFRLPPLDRDGLCRRFGLNPELKTVLIITEWFQAITSRYMVEQEESYIRLVLKSLKSHDGIQIVVKLHPGLQSRYHKIVSKIAEQEETKVVVARDSLWDLIRLSSLTIVSTSSVCIEALILGKPVISVNLDDQRDVSGLVQNGLAIGAFNEEEIQRSIGILMDSSGQNVELIDGKMQLLYPFIYLGDGSACQRVADLIAAKSIKSR